MADKVFPSSKPTATPPAATTTRANGGATKSDLINPTARLPYRPQPHNRRRQYRPRRNYCCCCCFWIILIILVLALLVAITGTVLYVFYRPHRPSFTLDSLRIRRLKLKTAADGSSSHLSTLFNNSDVLIGNGTLPAFVSDSKDESTFRGVSVVASMGLDAEAVNDLRPELKKGNGVLLKVEMDTKVIAKMFGLKSKKVGIRVTCDGIKGAVPKGKSPAVANVAGAKCRVDLRIKIWKWTF
ncbi:hypothetical protein F3Y22_tig00112636pilonHSYRG00021 [Hibiscus syriacus]|uniref:Late embryogenesis abundant protein LEA-2 subgroup domain-containing protein n=1 Tax=Hibiscus syriacus TaxID=106335 RepID=A0A6A2WUR7_HIBSY|nr:NDR1/HIN1-like protein 13 [Hibiscus syriacus]KAE8665263.1 hypothetical protein F3Y22_tig00112636pilonHSYRG00021 [Hibiscus syriacus]